jgi:lysophospholipase L1-like esterase
MVMRFRRDVLDAKPAWVLILGGTNDLGCQAAPAEIMRNLVALYEPARAAGIKVAAMTVPSIRAEARGEAERAWLQDHMDRRRDLNDRIRTYCRDRGSACLDVHALTAEPDTGLLAEHYSSDGLHLTTAGYRAMADLAYAELFTDASPAGGR